MLADEAAGPCVADHVGLDDLLSDGESCPDGDDPWLVRGEAELATWDLGTRHACAVLCIAEHV